MLNQEMNEDGRIRTQIVVNKIRDAAIAMMFLEGVLRLCIAELRWLRRFRSYTLMCRSKRAEKGCAFVEDQGNWLQYNSLEPQSEVRLTSQ